MFSDVQFSTVARLTSLPTAPPVLLHLHTDHLQKAAPAKKAPAAAPASPAAAKVAKAPASPKAKAPAAAKVRCVYRRCLSSPSIYLTLIRFSRDTLFSLSTSDLTGPWPAEEGLNALPAHLPTTPPCASILFIVVHSSESRPRVFLFSYFFPVSFRPPPTFSCSSPCLSRRAALLPQQGAMHRGGQQGRQGGDCWERGGQGGKGCYGWERV